MAVKFEKASSVGSKINLNNEDVLKELVSIAETKITEKGGSKADFAKNSSVLINQVKNKNIEISNLDSLTSTEALSVFANTATISDTLATEIKSQTTSTDTSSATSSDCVSTTTATTTPAAVTTVTALANCTTTTATPTTTSDCVSTTTATTTTTTVTALANCTTTTATVTAVTATPTTTTDTTTTTATTTTATVTDTTSTATTTTATTTTAAVGYLARDAEKIDSTWGTSGNDRINVGAFDDIVHTSGGNDSIILGSGSDTLIIENTTGHSVIRDFDINEDQVVLATGVFIEDAEIINDSFHLYTNFGGHVQFENIGDISTVIM